MDHLQIFSQQPRGTSKTHYSTFHSLERTSHLWWNIHSSNQASLSSRFWWPSIIHPFPHDSTVNLLKTTDSVTWDKHQLHLLYPEPVIKEILQQSSSIFDRPDHLIWKLSPDGKYSVSQGYHLLLQTQEASLIASSSASWSNWSWMWKLAIPHKYLVFLWRLIHATVPTTAILQDHHLNLTQHCLFCAAEDETLLHLFLHCPFARACWFGSSLSMLPNPAIQDFKSWLLQQLDIFSNKDYNLTSQCILFVVLFYQIWETRNQVFHRGKAASPTQVINRALFIIQQIHKAHNSKHDSLLSPRNAISTTFCPTLNVTHLLSQGIIHFYFHRNRGMLCVFALHTWQGNWKALHLWRNVDNRNRLIFFFGCIRDLMQYHLPPMHQFQCISLHKSGYATWITLKCAAPQYLQPVIQDIGQLQPPSTSFLHAGKESRTLLRQILQFLPYSYSMFNSYAFFTF